MSGHAITTSTDGVGGSGVGERGGEGDGDGDGDGEVTAPSTPSLLPTIGCPIAAAICPLGASRLLLQSEVSFRGAINQCDSVLPSQRNVSSRVDNDGIQSNVQACPVPTET